ncbi:DUF6480 family protein [Streptomyces maremycinicus]|nr:DUF6480 family protein [Streptomyces sp. NBRC 110468]
MSSAGARQTHKPDQGPGQGPRTVIIILVVLFAAFFLACAIVLMP